ncbi:MAG: PolC-type polymerase [Anaerosolibacter sp.]|jgi:DNA polymerase-3 subunit alpha (Gram-positive type)|uniref:PolC-type DNA polymerase III n=2 Tax=Anaerosolibacter sp. TaxID=1872527 RepID=UPI00262B2F94|nr:PolC-type DNA polymerase III [Anaerosolibacter sp.]MDF2545880.1 PolC-type polymerase [Anaerosolibacter sp.]
MDNILNHVFSNLLTDIRMAVGGDIEKIRYNQEKKRLDIVVLPKEIVYKQNLEKIKERIYGSLSFLQEINFFTVYRHMDIDQESIIKIYKDNILFELNQKLPSTLAWMKNAEFQLENDLLYIRIESELGVESLKEKKVDHFIERILSYEFGISIKVILIYESEEETGCNEEYLKLKEEETQNLLKGLINQLPERADILKDPKEKGQNIEGVILGKRINEVKTPISDVTEESGSACIEGEIFSLETRELKNGKTLFTLCITDYTGSIAAKIFAKKEQTEVLDETLSIGKYIRLKGEARYDTFSRELIIMANDINEARPVVRVDKSEHKRIELHAHTQMSSMDGVSSTSSLVKRAAKWGHPAIAITDHGVVQAFPEAMEAGKKHDIKVIYGVEGYLVNDGAPIVLNCNNKPLDQCYVVFDIETTGLSSKHDGITEIGAVKISEGKVIDHFNMLVNPERAIPSNIVELTGISDEMLRDQPKIEEVLPKFLEFVGENPVVAHNAGFDTSFIKENCHRLGLSFDNPVVDTLSLAKILMPKLKKYKLNIIATALGVVLKNHHRAVDDAGATAEIFIQFLNLLKERNISELREINELSNKNADIKKMDTYHIIILVKNYTGLKNLYKIISASHMNYFYKRPRIPKSLLTQMREGLIIGTACEAGELYRAITSNKSKREIEEIVKYYDYLEIQPIHNNTFLIDKGIVKDEEELRDINKKIVDLGTAFHKPVVATGDVHFLDPHDEAYRRILMAGQGFDDADEQTPLYFRTTDEMLKEFEYLGKHAALDVVVNYPNHIANQVDHIIPIPDDTFPPIIEGSDEDLRRMCYEKATRIYGDPLPELVQKRLDRELNSIISNGYAVMYIIAQKLVAKSLQDGYLVGSRGSVGSSFVATMSNITEVNPLPPHYVCPNCKDSEFITDGSIGSGADLPDKVCPKCNIFYLKDGHDIPFEVFLGFEGDKEPDIDLNFAGEYQPTAHKYTEELFGEGYVFRAGTIGTIADKTAYGFVKKYYEEKQIPVNNREIERLAKGCTGVKRTTGQHPGGVMVVPNYKEIYDFCPIQYPANDGSSGIITTHFDYHSISGRLLKLDILGHDVPTIIRMLQDITGVDPTQIPLDDKETVKIFTSLDPLKIVDKEFICEVGSLGIPEFGTKFVRQMLVDTQPSTFAELVRISGLSHGTDVWLNNAQELVRQGTAELKDVISTRDDIMNYLIYKGLPPKTAFKIMEKVRKGKGLSPEDEEAMAQNKVPKWYIDSCNKIKYMFPKAHAVAYVMMSFRIAYFKVHYPLAFYATYFTTKASDFDADLVVRGKEKIKNKMKELETLGNAMSQKEKDLLTVLEVASEMYARGLHFLPVDIYKSDAEHFKIVEDKLLPPLCALQGVGENAAKSICESRKDREFISLEDLRTRAKVTKTVIETLQNHGCLDGLPNTNQLSLF